VAEAAAAQAREAWVNEVSWYRQHCSSIQRPVPAWCSETPSPAIDDRFQAGTSASSSIEIGIGAVRSRRRGGDTSDRDVAYLLDLM